MPLPSSLNGKNKNEDVVSSIHHLEKTVKQFLEEYKLMSHPWKSFFIALARGVAYGLGILLATAIVVPIIVYSLRSINWVPLVGDFVMDIAERVEEVQRR